MKRFQVKRSDGKTRLVCRTVVIHHAAAGVSPEPSGFRRRHALALVPRVFLRLTLTSKNPVKGDSAPGHVELETPQRMTRSQ